MSLKMPALQLPVKLSDRFEYDLMKIIALSFVISIVILVIAFAVAHAHLSNVNALLILHFDQYRGPNYTGSVQDVFLIVLSGMGISLINYLLARGLYLRERFLAMILSISSMVVASLILIAVSVIISNN